MPARCTEVLHRGIVTTESWTCDDSNAGGLLPSVGCSLGRQMRNFDWSYARRMNSPRWNDAGRSAGDWLTPRLASAAEPCEAADAKCVGESCADGQCAEPVALCVRRVGDSREHEQHVASAVPTDAAERLEPVAQLVDVPPADG